MTITQTAKTPDNNAISMAISTIVVMANVTPFIFMVRFNVCGAGAAPSSIREFGFLRVLVKSRLVRCHGSAAN